MGPLFGYFTTCLCSKHINTVWEKHIGDSHTVNSSLTACAARTVSSSPSPPRRQATLCHRKLKHHAYNRPRCRTTRCSCSTWDSSMPTCWPPRQCTAASWSHLHIRGTCRSTTAFAEMAHITSTPLRENSRLRINATASLRLLKSMLLMSSPSTSHLSRLNPPVSGQRRALSHSECSEHLPRRL